MDWLVCMTKPDRGALPSSLPEVVIHTVKMACELPDQRGCSLSQWDCQRLADQLVKEGVVSSISRETVRRILADHRLKPWRYQLWLSPKVPRDAAFVQTVRIILALYTRELEEGEMVLCVDEKTSLQPRPRLAPSQKMRPEQPLRLEHEYKRAGALNLLAAFDTRSGKVYGYTAERKRQVEFITFLEQLDKAIESTITRIYIVLDNVPMHKGKQVAAWLAAHPRFNFVHPPVHCSWINQVEQWFSILQRKRFGIVNFKNLEELAERIAAFISEWNEKAHPFKWTKAKGAKLIERFEQKIGKAIGPKENGDDKEKQKVAEKSRTPQRQEDYSLQPVIRLREGINIRQSKDSWRYALVA
jgi:transposase